MKARLSEFEPTRLSDEKVKEIKAVMRSYARSKGVEELPEVGQGWDG